MKSPIRASITAETGWPVPAWRRMSSMALESDVVLGRRELFVALSGAGPAPDHHRFDAVRDPDDHKPPEERHEDADGSVKRGTHGRRPVSAIIREALPRNGRARGFMRAGMKRRSRERRGLRGRHAQAPAEVP